jgi:hypothetical protein
LGTPPQADSSMINLWSNPENLFSVMLSFTAIPNVFR